VERHGCGLVLWFGNEGGEFPGEGSSC
jgi:hypothetical protein